MRLIAGKANDTISTTSRALAVNYVETELRDIIAQDELSELPTARASKAKRALKEIAISNGAFSVVIDGTDYFICEDENV